MTLPIERARSLRLGWEFLWELQAAANLTPEQKAGLGEILRHYPLTSEIEADEQSRLHDRREAATERAKKVIQFLASKAVRARVIGSLVTNRFTLHSDVDFLIEECPRHLKYSIEADVESIMLEIPFDVLYEDELPRLDRDKKETQNDHAK